jgi:ATP-dependent DNA helicase HFM1/MER3
MTSLKKAVSSSSVDHQMSTPTPVHPKFAPINKSSRNSTPVIDRTQPGNHRTRLDDLRDKPNPPSAIPETRNNINLLAPSSVLPDRLQSLFPYSFFNAMQSETFSSIYGSDKNIVLSAPTGSGKTVCFDFAIARLMSTDVSEDAFKAHSLCEALMSQVVYIGPTKSLCQERVKDWNMRLMGLRKRCIYCQQSFANQGGELTGDTDGDTASTIRDNDIIVTTPEKWDSVTRKLKDHARLTDMIRLLLV